MCVSPPESSAAQVTRQELEDEFRTCEGARQHGPPTDHDFTVSLYWRYLGRGPDGTLARNTERLASGEQTRQELEDEFRTSLEARRHGPSTNHDFTVSLYWRYLGREPDERLDYHTLRIEGVQVELEWNDVNPAQYPGLEHTVRSAAELALRYVTRSLAFLHSDESEWKALYVEFFGELEETRAQTVWKVFSDILDEYLHKRMTFVVTNQLLANESLLAKTVRDTRSGRFELGGGFLTAPLRGKDSKCGTIIHETSHNVVDHVTDQSSTYSLEDVQALARNEPERAVRCAESYEYFVEQGVKRRLIHVT